MTQQAQQYLQRQPRLNRRRRILHPALRGLGITFIVTGLMAIGFMMFGGISL